MVTRHLKTSCVGFKPGTYFQKTNKAPRPCPNYAAPPQTANCNEVRRVLKLMEWVAGSVMLTASFSPHSLAQIPPPPEVGSCIECIGEVNGGLNACTLASPSCVSTQNDDEAHFVPPWQYSGGVESAVENLINVATGGELPVSELVDSSSQGLEKPVKVKFSQGNQQKRACFSASLEDRHKTDDGSEYLHFIFGSQKDKNPECSNLGVLDAEFIFLANDNIVDIRTASREDPGIRGGNLSLSLSYGVQYDTNVAKRLMEDVRKALRWEQTPVVTDFDPRFNQRRPLFFEKLYQPFLRDNQKQDFEEVVDK